jgi:alkanesulfonate monooxygenase SsuD/methylene tetrahydromethanopterin reductase-like flavin-dependent oxidoreductase (luciferase family)
MSGITGQRIGFGVGLVTAAADPAPDVLPDLVRTARLAEDLGFSLVTVSDHASGSRPSLEAWTALSFVAARTRRIEIAPVVLGLPYRHPAVLAKMSETLDRLSGGRLVLGLGAGGFDEEFAAFGLPTLTPGGKVTALREAVDILRGLWSAPAFTFSGKQFTLHCGRIEPRPEHRIPLWLGSYGDQALALTGQLADGWIPSLPRLGLSRAAAMRAKVRAAAQSCGRDPDSITCSCNVAVRIGRDLPPEPNVVQGDADSVVAQFVEIIRAGFTFPVCHLDSSRQQELFATEVIPRVTAEFTAVL